MKAVPTRLLLGSSCHRLLDSSHRAFSEVPTHRLESQPKSLNQGLLNLIQGVDPLKGELPRPVRSQQHGGDEEPATSIRRADGRSEEESDNTHHRARAAKESRSRWTTLNRRGSARVPSKTRTTLSQASDRGNKNRKNVNWEQLDQDETSRPATLKSQKFKGELWREDFKRYGKPLSDHICARLFATKAFSPSTIIKGLEMLSMTAIGPLALRQLASREQSASGTAGRISQLHEAGIKIDKSRMSRLIHRLANTGRDTALLELLDGDLHPDTMEDDGILEKLLVSHHTTGSWSDFRKTLVLLTALDSNPRQAALDVLSKHDLLNMKTFAKSLRQVEELRSAHVRIPSPIFTTLVQQAWDQEVQYRLRGKVEDLTGSVPNSLTLATRSLLQSLYSGQQIPPLLWRSVLLRLGYCGRLDEMASLTTELIEWYCKPDKTADGTRRQSPFPAPRSPELISIPSSGILNSQNTEIDIIFDSRLLGDIIQRPYLKYFLRPASSTMYMSNDRWKEEENAPQTWASGIHLARKISDSGVKRVENVIQSACLDMVFGTSSIQDEYSIPREADLDRKRHGISEKQIRRARINNTLPVGSIAAGMNRAWGRILFEVEADSSSVGSFQPSKPPIRMIE